MCVSTEAFQWLCERVHNQSGGCIPSSHGSLCNYKVGGGGGGGALVPASLAINRSIIQPRLLSPDYRHLFPNLIH